jgi:hypothetical protein
LMSSLSSRETLKVISDDAVVVAIKEIVPILYPQCTYIDMWLL